MIFELDLFELIFSKVTEKQSMHLTFQINILSNSNNRKNGSQLGDDKGVYPQGATAGACVRA